METQQSWRVKLSFKNATIIMTVVNVITALILLQCFLSSRNKILTDQYSSVQLKYIKESEGMRLAMQPWELIKRVKEIEQESYTEPETVQQQDTKQTAAADVSKRLTNMHSFNDAASLKALEEWRARKMERAKRREMEKNGTKPSQS